MNLFHVSIWWRANRKRCGVENSFIKKPSHHSDHSSRLSVDARHGLAANSSLQRLMVQQSLARASWELLGNIFAQRSAFSVTICSRFNMKMCHPVVIKLPRPQRLQSFPYFLFIFAMSFVQFCCFVLVVPQSFYWHFQINKKNHSQFRLCSYNWVIHQTSRSVRQTSYKKPIPTLTWVKEREN